MDTPSRWGPPGRCRWGGMFNATCASLGMVSLPTPTSDSASAKAELRSSSGRKVSTAYRLQLERPDGSRLTLTLPSFDAAVIRGDAAAMPFPFLLFFTLACEAFRTRGLITGRFRQTVV